MSGNCYAPVEYSLASSRYEWGWGHAKLWKVSIQVQKKTFSRFLQATLVNSCRAKLWIWLLGKGTKPLPLRKSNTLWPRRSVTIQMWFRKSNASRRCIHLLRFALSLSASVESTLSSILEASRYFCTERIILMATFVFFRLSYASTTLPNVPWPRSLLISSKMLLVSDRLGILVKQTSFGQGHPFFYNIVTVLVVDFLVLM